EPDAAIRFADDIIGTIDPLALVAVHHDLALPIVGPAGDPAIAAFADHKSTLQIKRRAVAFRGSGAHGFRRLAEPQPVEHAAADIGKIIISVGMPQWAFGKDETRRRAFRRRRFQDRVQPGHPHPPIERVLPEEATPGPRACPFPAPAAAALKSPLRSVANRRSAAATAG